MAWKPVWSGIAGFLLFGLATLGAYLAQNSHKPISAALIYVVGVTLIGAMAGLKGGLLAGIGASVLYNFFLSEPLLQFGASSADDYFPLLAFNLTALLSGGLAGRLNDRAVAAEDAQARINLLLSVSSRLQNVTDMEGVESAIGADGAPDWLAKAQFYDLQGRGLSALAAPHDPLADRVCSTGLLESDGEGRVAHLLSTRNGPLAVVIFPGLAQIPPRSRSDIGTLLTLLSLALERMALLEQQAEAVALRRSEEFKTALLASMSHDMRSPLAAITASASSLASYGSQLDAEVQTQMLRTIEHQCDRLNRYTANLLSMAELQGGIGGSRLSPVDVMEILGAVLTAVRARSPTHVIRRDFRCTEAVVHANAVMTEQMLHNILDNAVRYAPSDSQITIMTVIENSSLIVTIRDEGPGIAEAELPHIFERFYRAAATSQIEGQGLGLAISKGFAEAFGGRIDVMSPVGDGGTQFTISLPLADAQGRSR